MCKCSCKSNSWHKVRRCFVGYFKGILYCAAVLLPLLFLAILIGKSYDFQIKVITLDDWRDVFIYCHPILDLAVVSITACIAVVTYESSVKAKEVELSLKVRDLLNDAEKASNVYNSVKNQSGTFDEVSLNNYLGILEQVWVMYKNGIISESQLNMQFIYRIEDIIDDEEKMNKIQIEEKYWTNLFEFINYVKKSKK